MSPRDIGPDRERPENISVITAWLRWSNCLSHLLMFVWIMSRPANLFSPVFGLPMVGLGSFAMQRSINQWIEGSDAASLLISGTNRHISVRCEVRNLTSLFPPNKACTKMVRCAPLAYSAKIRQSWPERCKSLGSPRLCTFLGVVGQNRRTLAAPVSASHSGGDCAPDCAPPPMAR